MIECRAVSRTDRSFIAEPGQRARTMSYHVIVVEDDASMRQAIRRVLQMEGFTIEGFGSAEDALASGVGERADCLVLDVRLPGQSGVELWQALKDRGSDVPTVFITAFDNSALRRRALQGNCCYLTKPFLGETLVEAVTRAVR
jgi:FixJ family two-component response regulator